MKEHIKIASIDVEEGVLFGKIEDVIKYLQGIKTQYNNGETIYLNQE